MATAKRNRCCASNTFFGPTGAAKWRGQIYGTPRFSWFIDRPVIYHGIFGDGFFQSIYPTPQSDVAVYLGSVEWFGLTIFLFGLGVFLPVLRIVPYLMFGGTLCVARLRSCGALVWGVCGVCGVERQLLTARGG